MLESLGSARIEGNHTTLADYVESKLNNTSSDQLLEMKNIESAMLYIEENIQKDDNLSEYFIRELHQITVKNLHREGDDNPGSYRKKQVAIANSSHLPPEFIQVPGYMEELVHFINKKNPSKYDLIKVALAHHRFGWIHPFGNGNGRVVRLLTYALLIKYGFNVTTGGRVLNPTAIFCNNRDTYYSMLEKADTGTKENLECWCIYVLKGVSQELHKLDKLSDFNYLKNKILLPAFNYAKNRKLITQIEADLLQIAAERGVVKSSDFTKVMATLNPSQRTYQIKKLVENGMLHPIKEGARQYVVGFSHSYLIRGVIKSLSEQGFIPTALLNN